MSSESDKYEVLEKIGHGSFGVIRKVRRKLDGLVMCRKEISYLKMSQKEREQLHVEFQILSHLRHPNIVGYYHREHLKATQDLHLYMEYCGNGDLGRVIRDLTAKGQRAQESFVWSIFAQLVTALYRCHYGIDPPEVGTNILGLGEASGKPKTPAGTMTILHRDLKPENVFLGEGNSVKLGDFGLSKMIQSHDFASTYVGTPFYMSPEISAAERYTLKSDIWSLGCLIYELCAREPPFNAKSHFQLVQKIKDGKVAPLPDIYSQELMQTIKDCLKVNPDHRPETFHLLNLPIVRLMRKEKEVVDLGKAFKQKEEGIAVMKTKLENELASAATDKSLARQQIEASLRREWEVKARLEIDRQVQIELAKLQERFETEVQLRVDTELQKKAVIFAPEPGEKSQLLSSQAKSASGNPYSSVGAASADGDFPSTTDISELSTDTPDVAVTAATKKSAARTPFGRAQTMFPGPVGTPMDVEMASPSPIAIASLALSPRRNAGAKAPSANAATIFPPSTDPKWDLPREPARLDSDDEDVFPSPTRQARSAKNPFSAKSRPVLQSQKSAPLNRLKPQGPSVGLPSKVGKMQSNPDLDGRGVGGSKDRCPSPNRRLSKIPSAANLTPVDAPTGVSQLTRKPSVTKKDSEAQLGKVAAKNNIKGRTLVELQQARAGGRPVSAVAPATGGENASPKKTFRDRVAERRLSGGDAAVWDPDRDEMPSPFLIRRKNLSRS